MEVAVNGKRKSPGASNSGSDSDLSRRRAAKLITMKKLRSQVALCKAQLEEPFEAAFCDEYSVELDPVPWFAQLSLQSLVHVLSVESPTTKSYVLNFKRLAEIATSSKFTYIMFFTDVPGEKTPTNLWFRLTEQWLPLKAPGETVPRKFTFLQTFITKNWYKGFNPPEIKAMEAYLNRYGAGFCEKCGMFPNLRVRTDQKRDLIPLSAFRLLSEAELKDSKTSYDDSELVNEFSKDIRNVPDWLRAMLSLRNLFDTKYCCINCKAICNQQLFCIATPSVFEACARRGRATSKNKDNHIWLELQYELTRPDNGGGMAGIANPKGKPNRGKEVIPGQYEYCCRCGLLRYEQTELGHEIEEQCPDCHKSECVCQLCDFCNGPSGCNCIICDRCNRCQSGCTKNCKLKGCRCDGSSSEPSLDLSDSEASSSSSSVSNSSDD